MANQLVNNKPTWGKIALGSFSQPDELAFIHQVYGWMCVGLVLTSAVAFWVSITPFVAEFIIGKLVVFLGLLAIEFIAVLFLAQFIHKISATMASIVFLGYSALNGLTFSVIFFVYTIGSISSVFFITAFAFIVMSIYGYITKRDLTTFGSFALMSLIGLIGAMIVNLFLKSDALGFTLACVGVLIFIVLTAFDTQKLKWLYQLGRTEGAEGEKKEAINGALTLYLDFINLFLDLLRILGKRK